MKNQQWKSLQFEFKFGALKCKQIKILHEHLPEVQGDLLKLRVENVALEEAKHHKMEEIEREKEREKTKKKKWGKDNQSKNT